MKCLTYEECRKYVDVVFQRVREEKGKPVSVAIADEHGDLVAFGRMDGAPARGVVIAIDKAYTAVRMSRDTHEFKRLLSEHGYQSRWFGDERFTALEGGLVLRDGDRCIGGIGVSGRSTGVEDIELANHAITVLARRS